MRDGWRCTKLGEYISINTGKLDVNAASESGEFPFFTCSRETYRINEAAFDGESVIVAGNGDLNVKYYDGKFNAYQRTYVLKSLNRNNLDNRFLFIFMQTYIDFLRGETSGSVIQYLKKGQFTDAKIDLPPLPEQKRIVDLISTVDSYIEALQQQLESVKKCRNAVLHELLTAGGDDWVEMSISDLVAHSIGGIWGLEENMDEVDVTVVRSTEFTQSGFLNFSTGVTRSIKASQLQSRELIPGDILLEKSGGGPAQPVGRVVFVEDSIPPKTVCSNFVLLIRPDHKLVDSKFLFNVLLQWHFQNRTLEFQAQTTGIRNLRTNDYLDQKLLLPPLVKQEQIVNSINRFDEHILNLDAASLAARKLRSGLLSDLLSGNHEIPASYDKVMVAA
jgi:type I restriction enzyme S subunit